MRRFVPLDTILFVLVATLLTSCGGDSNREHDLQSTITALQATITAGAAQAAPTQIPAPGVGNSANAHLYRFRKLSLSYTGGALGAAEKAYNDSVVGQTIDESQGWVIYNKNEGIIGISLTSPVSRTNGQYTDGSDVVLSVDKADAGTVGLGTKISFTGKIKELTCCDELILIDVTMRPASNH